MDDIIKAIASKHAGSVLSAVAPKPVVTERVYSFDEEPAVRRTTVSGPTYLGTERLGSTTRIITGIRREKPIPTRKPVDFDEFGAGELEELLLTKVERNWYFETWLEYIGLPKDLDHRHDPIFGMCLDAYMTRKRASHGR